MKMQDQPPKNSEHSLEGLTLQEFVEMFNSSAEKSGSSIRARAVMPPTTTENDSESQPNETERNGK